MKKWHQERLIKESNLKNETDDSMKIEQTSLVQPINDHRNGYFTASPATPLIFSLSGSSSSSSSVTSAVSVNLASSFEEKEESPKKKAKVLGQ